MSTITNQSSQTCNLQIIIYNNSNHLKILNPIRNCLVLNTCNLLIYNNNKIIIITIYQHPQINNKLNYTINSNNQLHQPNNNYNSLSWKQQKRIIMKI